MGCLFSRSACTQLGIVIDCEHHALSSRRLGVKSFGMGRDEGHYTVRIDEFESESAGRELPPDFQLPAGVDASRASRQPQVPSGLRHMASQEAPADSNEPQVPRCKLCNGTDHRTKNCPKLMEVSEDESFAMVTDQGEDGSHGRGRTRSRWAAGLRMARSVLHLESQAMFKATSQLHTCDKLG